MYSPVKIWAAFAVCVAIGGGAPAASCAQSTPSIQRVQVLRGAGQVEIEFEASAKIVPQTNLIAGPDRLIVDFVNAVPGSELRNLAVNRKEVKSLRVGLFSADPPVTRVVLDLNGPQPYQVFPSGKTVILKVGAPGTETAKLSQPSGPALVELNFAPAPSSNPAASTPAPPPPPAKPPLEVTFRNGLLTIHSNQASLSEILFAVHQRTGAEIAIPAGAEQEKVVVSLGPAPAPEVLAHLLNGSSFNFLIMSSASDARNVDQVILSPRGEGVSSANTPLQPLPAEEEQLPPPVEPPPTGNRNPAEGEVPPPNNDAPN